MNRSGQAVSSIAHFFAIEPGQILVAHDELDLLPGTARLKSGGGHGGHNGLRDIIKALGSADFHRLRIGIGHPGSAREVVDYVLQAPSKPDREAIDAAIKESIASLPLLLTGDMARAMTRLHSFHAT
jgi:peptidyl-tRNA hydrolase, PTH1 family